jgi:amidohydrolase
MIDLLPKVIGELSPRLTEIRHHLHQNPELSEHEVETAKYVAHQLRILGLEPQTEVGGHGIVAEIEGAKPGKRLGIRADMDALPIQEENEVPYCSRNPGVMHACGHDGHTTVLLGTAQILTQLRHQLRGSVRLIFQPAEETVGGAKRMCGEGVMEGVDAVVALHGWPQVGLRQVGLRKGPMMASADTFDIVVNGRGGHAAYPHATVDPIVIGSEIVSALQTISSREIDPNDPVVVSVTRFEAGTAYNVIPGSARLYGTYRTLSAATRSSMPDRIRRITEGICQAHGATCDLAFRVGTPPVMNDPAIIDLMERAAVDALGASSVVHVPYPSMGAEDFSEYLAHAPGAMFRLGLGPVSPIHTPTFNFDDRALPIGVEMFCRIALEYLG